MIAIKQLNPPSILEVKVTGKFEKEDYQTFGRQVEDLIRSQGKIRVLFLMEEFHGWSIGGLWEDLKFDAKHFNDIERLALVGDRKWEKGMAEFCKPFTTAKVHYFDMEQMSDAKAWIVEETETKK
jgi:hypothetical protein